MPLFNAPPDIPVADSPATTATARAVTAVTTSAQLLAINTNRKGVTLFNDSTADLFIEFGLTASTTAYTVKIPAGGYYELPFPYTGVISGIWSAANGKVLIREFV